MIVWYFFAAPVVFGLFGVYAFGPSTRPWLNRLRSAMRAHLLVFTPLVFLALADSGEALDCCNTSLLLSPDHRLTAYAVMLLTWLSYAYSSLQKQPGPPLLEVLASCMLLLGWLFNLAMFLHVSKLLLQPELEDDLVMALLGCGPVAWLLGRQALKNVQRNARRLAPAHAGWSRDLQRLLSARWFVVWPLLLLLVVPLAAVQSVLLLVLGQRPDSLIRVFTDTHHGGLSALREACVDVQCPGHYLCSVAALGHPRWVKPLRYGVRGGRRIVVNRQLLVANAFEEVVQERLPRLHRVLRRNYDRVGVKLHRHYHWFDNPWVSDAMYLAMKPLEWCFLGVLYLHDVWPEQRIGRQYTERVR